MCAQFFVIPVADPGFSRGRGKPTPKGVFQPIILQIVCQKLHGNERNWAGGVRILSAPTWIRHSIHRVEPWCNSLIKRQDGIVETPSSLVM